MRVADIMLYSALWGCALWLAAILVLGALDPYHQVVVLTNRYQEMWIEVPLVLALVLTGAWRLWHWAGRTGDLLARVSVPQPGDYDSTATEDLLALDMTSMTDSQARAKLAQIQAKAKNGNL